MCFQGILSKDPILKKAGEVDPIRKAVVRADPIHKWLNVPVKPPVSVAPTTASSREGAWGTTKLLGE